MSQKHLAPLLLALLAGCAVATSPSPTKAQASDAAAQFERIKSLAGVWTGTAGHGDQATPVEVRYRLTSGGTAVEEVLMPTPVDEMVTLYHLDRGRLMLTHYCSAGNQPRMVASPWTQDGDRNAIRFAFLDATNLASPADGHMHEMEFQFLTPDRVQTQWAFFVDGKPVERAHFDLTRKTETP